MSDRPLIVQSDRTMLLDMHSSSCAQCREEITAFSELVKSPEHLHTYRLSALSIWNACSQSFTAQMILSVLEKYSRFPVPEPVSYFISDTCSRYGIVTFTPCDDRHFYLNVSNDIYRKQILSLTPVRKLVLDMDEDELRFESKDRGTLKVILIDNGFPVEDLIPLKKGEPVDISLRTETLSGKPFSLRGYQEESFSSFYASGRPGGGYGVIVLPCGSGKTVVGMRAMAELRTSTLILAPNVAAVHQWMRELEDKTTLTSADIGEFSGEKKDIRKVTVCTYSMLIYRDSTDDEFHNFEKILAHDWGLVIYDEVHMLPAPVFRLSASLQAVFRLGLTATLIREDGREKEVFSLVGPKRYDVPWSELERQGFIASAHCHEIRVSLDPDDELEYALAPLAKKNAIAARNKRKLDVVQSLLEKHQGQQILIIGQYLDQLKDIQKRFSFPLITGSMANAKRDELYQAFRDGKISVLIVSKVANFAIDLPDASVAIQVSGTFGSRQEEAQRLGRILRPKQIDSNFYTIVSKHTREEDFSLNRQKFLVEQGYSYEVMDL